MVDTKGDFSTLLLFEKYPNSREGKILPGDGDEAALRELSDVMSEEQEHETHSDGVSTDKHICRDEAEWMGELVTVFGDPEVVLTPRDNPDASHEIAIYTLPHNTNGSGPSGVPGDAAKLTLTLFREVIGNNMLLNVDISNHAEPQSEPRYYEDIAGIGIDDAGGWVHFFTLRHPIPSAKTSEGKISVEHLLCDKPVLSVHASGEVRAS